MCVTGQARRALTGEECCPYLVAGKEQVEMHTMAWRVHPTVDKGDLELATLHPSGINISFLLGHGAWPRDMHCCM